MVSFVPFRFVRSVFCFLIRVCRNRLVRPHLGVPCAGPAAVSYGGWQSRVQASYLTELRRFARRPTSYRRWTDGPNRVVRRPPSGIRVRILWAEPRRAAPSVVSVRVMHTNFAFCSS